MTEDAKKVWQVMESDFGWSNQPKDFHLEYFEDIIKATKQALTIPVVVGRSEQLHKLLQYLSDEDELVGNRTHQDIIDSFNKLV